MANEERIDDLISPKAFEQVEKLETDLQGLQSALAKTIIEANKLNNSLAKSGNSRDFDNNAVKAEQAAERIKQAAAKTLLAQERLSAFRAKSAADFEKSVQREIAAQEKKSKQLEGASQKEITAEERKQAAYKKTAEQIAKNSRPYTVLSNTLETQRKRAQDLAIIYGENSKQFLEAAKSVNVLDTRLKAIDAVLGKSQRNVGNYRSGFNGLSNSINQITREFPAFTFSVQTGFLALSNNLPIFFDQIQQTRNEIKALRAEGQKVPGLFKQLASSIFSFGTVMSIGITLFTVYGKEIGNFIGAMFKGREAIDSFTESQKKLGEAMASSSVTDAVKNVTELRINIDLAKKGFLDKDKVLNQYNETVGKTTGEVKNLDQAEIELNKNAENYIKVTLLKAAAQLALEEAAKTAFEAEKARAQGEKDLQAGAVGNKAIQNLTFGQRLTSAFTQDENVTKGLIKKQTDNLVKDANNRTKTLNDIAAKFQKDAATAALQFGSNGDFFGGTQDGKDKKNKANTDALDRQIQLIEFEIEAQKKLANNEKATLEDRLSAVKNFTDASIRLADLSAQRELKQADLTSNKIASIEDKRKNDKITAASEGEAEIIKINEDAEKELARLIKDGLKAFEEGEKKKIEALQVSIKQQQEQLSLFADSALEGLAEQYSKGIINEQQYAQARLDIQRQYVLDSINEEIKGVEAIVEAKKKAGLDTASDEKSLADLRKKLSKETTDQQISDLEKLAEREKELNDKKKELAKEVAELGISIVNGVFENQKNKIQEQIDLTDQQAERDIENVNNSLATEQEKADKIAVIEAQAESRKKVLEQQQREVQQRQARFDRAVSIAKIIQNTAVGVTAALTSIPPNVPLSIVIGAIGLAQIGQLLATPIPQYFTGTNSSKGGLALTDELGPEGYITPSGKAFIGNDKPTLRNLEAGTKIIPHHEMVKLMGNPSSVVKVESDKMDVTALINSQQAETKKLIKAITKNKSVQRTNIKMNNMGEYIAKNFGKS